MSGWYTARATAQAITPTVPAKTPTAILTSSRIVVWCLFPERSTTHRPEGREPREPELVVEPGKALN
jgi:hypothetical protein